MRKPFFGLLLAILSLAVDAQPPASGPVSKDIPPLPTVTASFAAKHAIYAMVASNTYHKKESERVHFPVELLGWQLVDLNDQPTAEPTGTRRSGLAWDVYEKKDSDEVIFSFRGTDSGRDHLTANAMPWPFAIQYQQARHNLEKYQATHPQKHITLTGHSLGGGIAAGLSVRRGIDTVVFDPSPRIFDGWGDKHLPAETRVVIFQKGEALEKVRKVWPKLVKTFAKESFYMTEFDFNKFNAHRMDQLALGLLNLGALENDSGLAAVAEAANRKIPSASDAVVVEAISRRSK
jgi:hypothetical protein